MYTYNGLTNHVLAVTNRHLCSRPLAEQVARICSLRPQAIILREKDLPEESYRILAEEMIGICKNNRIPCILHTYVDTARKLGCPAIHLPLPLLRKYHTDLKDFRIIGVSIHSVEEALEAEQLGASYLTAGHIYSTDCKKNVPPRGLGFLQRVCQSTVLPVYAIGGIKLDENQLNEVIAHGAKGGCIMSGMMTL